MMPIQVCIVLFLNGFKDSLYGCIKFFKRQKFLASYNAQKSTSNSNSANITNNTINKSSNTNARGASSASANKKTNNEKLYQRLFESCVLNGVFLLACMLAFNYVLMPVLNSIYYKILSPEKHNLINDYLNPLLHVLFSFVWILPVFLLSKIFNLLWHQEIADIAYLQKYPKPQTKFYFDNKLFIAQVIADTVFSCTMELIFLVQSSFMNFIPISWLSQIVCHIHLAFLYSLYAFEYKWCNMTWDIQKRIDFIELRWPYYLGFGLSLSIILSFAGSYIYSATLFAFIFPAFILSAIEADCENITPIVYYKRDINYKNGFRPVYLRLPLFKLSLVLTDFIFKIFEKKQKPVNAPTNSSQTKTSPQNRIETTFSIKKIN